MLLAQFLLVTGLLLLANGQTLEKDIPETMADARKPVAGEKPTSGERYDWNAAGRDELEIAKWVAENQNKNKAKNVILFIGDSMGLSTVTAGRFWKSQVDSSSGREALLTWDRFPHVGLSMTHSFDRMTIDSAGSASALLGGEKTFSATMGIKPSAARQDCTKSQTERQTTILDYSLMEGKAVGIVTSARLTHATPAAAYAHVPDRRWEANIPAEFMVDGCKDVAAQLIEENDDIQVLLGGGRQYFMGTNESDPEYPDKMGSREDKRNLINLWLEKMNAKNGGDDSKYKYVWKKDDFDSVDPEKVDYLLGMFEQGHVQYQSDRDEAMEPDPVSQVEKAIKILRRNDKGFFLLVEGARIDHANHASNPFRVVDEVYSMSKQVDKVLEMMDLKDTLVIVTADHSSNLVVNGYPSINRNILLTSDFVTSHPEANGTMDDDKPYMILSYTNGPGRQNRVADGNGCMPRTDYTGYSEEQLTDKDFVVDSPENPRGYATHGGEDVGVYATGAMAHLIHGVHEESYIAHVMRYASCVGPHTNEDHCDGSGASIAVYNFLALTLCLILATFW